MSEEIKILLGFGSVLAVVLFVFTRLCKPYEEETVKFRHSFSIPKQPSRPPMWGLESGTKVIFELDGKVVGGFVAGFNSGKYAIKRIYHDKCGSHVDYHIVSVNDIIPVKEGNEND